MEQIYLNIRYLLWTNLPTPVMRDQWPSLLAQWLHPALGNGSFQRATEILFAKGRPLSVSEQQAIASATGEVEDLFNSVLYDVDETLGRNIKFLFDIGPHGTQSRVAKELDINPSTIHRWIANKSKPSQKRLPELRDVFNLPADTDLQNELLYLDPDCVTVEQKKAWLHDRIDTIGGEDLKLLYPALKRILSDQNGTD